MGPYLPVTHPDSLAAKSPASGALFITAGEETMSTIKATNWLVGGMIAVFFAATLVYLDPPTPGRAFTKNQSPPSQEQTSGANHKRTSGDFNW
jgi:hypothetical protein